MGFKERDGRCENCDHTVADHVWFRKCRVRTRRWFGRCRCRYMVYGDGEES